MLTYVTEVGKLYNILLNKEKRGLGALEKIGRQKNPKTKSKTNEALQKKNVF